MALKICAKVRLSQSLYPSSHDQIVDETDFIDKNGEGNQLPFLDFFTR